MQKQMHRRRKQKENIIPSLSCCSSATPALGNGLLPFRDILDVTCSNVWRKQLKCDGAAFFLIKQSLRHHGMAPIKPRTLQVCLLGGRCWPHSSSTAEGLPGPSGGLLSDGPDLLQALSFLLPSWLFVLSASAKQSFDPPSNSWFRDLLSFCCPNTKGMQLELPITSPSDGKALMWYRVPGSEIPQVSSNSSRATACDPCKRAFSLGMEVTPAFISTLSWQNKLHRCFKELLSLKSL